MDNLKNKIAKIFEAPIPDSEMPSSHYMTEDRAYRAATKNVAPLLKQIQDYITNMSWTEITFDTSGSTNYPILPQALLTMMSKMYLANTEYHKPLDVYGTGPRSLTSTEKKIYNKIAHLNFSTSSDFNANYPLNINLNGSYVFKGVTGTGSTHYVNMTCGHAGDRTHFPNGGINKGLKGLGQKLYRKLINKYGWVQTNSGGTGIKDLMWDSLTDFKYLSDGTRDTESEIYSFRFGDALYALDTMQVPELQVQFGHQIINKIREYGIISSKQLRKSNNIAIDPDYIAYVKRVMPTLNASTKSLAAEMLDWLEPDPALAAERERLKREREEAEANARNVAISTRLQAFCGMARIQDLRTDWVIGSWVVLKSYLVDDSTAIKIRKVVKKTDQNYAALKNTDLPAFNADGSLNDVRNATNDNREQWVIALPPAVGTNLAPGTYGISANAPRETNTPNTLAAATPAPTASTATSTANSSNVQSLFNTVADRETTYNFDNPVRKRFLTRRIDNPFVYLTDWIPENCKIGGTPIFGYFVTGTSVKTLYNSKTMEDVRVAPTDWDAIQPGLMKYRRTPISDKRDLTEGTLVFIKQHSKYFGYIAKVLSTSLTARGDKYVYLRVPGAGTNNRLTLTPIALEKMTPVGTNESNGKEYGTLFGKVFENYLEDVKTDLFDNK